jgi:DNA polymerase III epsilon subunit-like protein
MILFFDTETTGLPKNWKAPVTDLDNWPRLVQLAYLVYDFAGNLIHSCNEIVKPNGFKIPLDASNVHGITTDIANQRGSQIEEVFELFSIHLKRAKVIVAHNMAYDEKIIGSEFFRLGLENVIDGKEKICTMESSVELCKIEGQYGYKWPKLEELHRFLFNHDFEGAHDALADIQATAKCFWELEKKGIIHLTGKYVAPFRKSLFDKLMRSTTIEKSPEKNVPFLIIDRNGDETWHLYNTAHDYLDPQKIDYDYIVERDDPYIWDNHMYFQDCFHYSTINWKGWTLKNSYNLCFKNNIVINLTAILNSWFGGAFEHCDFLIYDSTERDISKLICVLEYPEDDPGDAYYSKTVFYFNDKGKIFLENNYIPPKEFEIWETY